MREANHGRVAKLTAGILAIAAISAAALAFAAGTQPAGIDPRLLAKAEGSSGWKWIGGNRESPYMHPGLDCIACHAKSDGPAYLSAGTVYAKADEKDDWLGVPGAVVHIKDANGQGVKLTTNAAGNFWLAAGTALKYPLTARVYLNGKERVMYSPLTNANCMSCHTAAGLNGAPGRIMVP